MDRLRVPKDRIWKVGLERCLRGPYYTGNAIVCPVMIGLHTPAVVLLFTLPTD